MITRGPDDNIYGVETEYSYTLTMPDTPAYEIVGSCHSKDTQLSLYEAPVENAFSDGGVLGLRGALQFALMQYGLVWADGGFVSNGGRFYFDPSGPEYSTPEARTAEEAVVRCFDGDTIILRAFAALRAEGIIESFQINRKAVDHNRTSRATHLNHLSLLTEEYPGLIHTIAGINAVKGAMFGSGGLLLDEHGRTHYHHAPRLSVSSERLHALYGESNARPLVRTNFKQDGSFKRIETVTNDTLSFPWALRASLVFSNAVFRLIEAGRIDVVPRLRDPLRAARIIGRFGNTNDVSIEDPSTKVRHGEKPARIIRELCDRALRLEDNQDYFSAEMFQVLEEIIEVTDLISTDPQRAVPYVESIARKEAIDRKIEQSGEPIGSERLCRFDYYWDKLGGGIAEQLRRKPQLWRGFANPAIHRTQNQILTPPTDTRANARGALIRNEKDDEVGDWSNYFPRQSTDETGKKRTSYTHIDPFNPQIPAFYRD